jgi:hypothetical protein
MWRVWSRGIYRLWWGKNNLKVQGIDERVILNESARNG